MKAGVSLLAKPEGGDGGGERGCVLDGERKDGTDEREMKTRGWHGTFVFGGVQPFDSKTTRRTRLRST